MVGGWSRHLKRVVCPHAREVPVTDPRCFVILQRFSAMEDCPEDWPDDWRPNGAPMVRRWSTVYRLDSARSGKSICLKVVNGGTRALEESEKLHAALRHYHARSDRDKGYTVPEPYGWVPEHAAVIMEWVEGLTYGDMLKRELFSRKRRHENLRKVGGWLRWFHEQSPVESESLEKLGQLRGITKVFRKAGDVKKEAASHDPLLRRYLEVAGKSAGVLQGAEIDCAMLHGDFKPTNVLISPAGVVTGIDIADGRRGPVSHDICRFLSDVDFYRNLLGRRFALGPVPRSNDFEAFLSGYGGRAAEIGRRAFGYLYFLTILSVLVNQRKKFQGGTVAMIRLAIFRRIAKELSDEMSPPAGRMAAAGVPGWMRWRLLPPVIMEWALVIWDRELVRLFV